MKINRFCLGMVLTIISTFALGQTQSLPDAPESRTNTKVYDFTYSASPPYSGFWTKTQIAQSLIFAGLVTYDGASTQYLKGQGFVELDPIARPFVNRGPAGQVAACAIGWGTLTGVQWVAYHFGHRKIAYALGYAAMGIEGVNDIRQASLVKSTLGNKF